MPLPQFTHADLRHILIDRIGLSETDIPADPDTPFADIGLDSLAVVEVQLAVQQEYGFSIPDSDAGVMTTLAEAVDYVNGRLTTVGAV
jgi:acyl carrier protein